MEDAKKQDVEIITLGVYGSTEESFFRSLLDENVDTFCDVRRHRGLRGSRYKYANSKRLQNRLDKLGIRYRHFKELSPPKKIRERQKEADRRSGTKKRDREELGQTFVESYRSEILDPYDFDRFWDTLPSDASTLALFCVERAPEACHRSLLAERLAAKENLDVHHTTP